MTRPLVEVRINPMAKNPKKPKRKRKPRPDFSQSALAVVEKAIGGKLAHGIPKKSNH